MEFTPAERQWIRPVAFGPNRVTLLNMLHNDVKLLTSERTGGWSLGDLCEGTNGVRT